MGALLVLSGFQKLVVPYQNFMYVIQSYQFLPGAFEEIVARTMPWAELFVGISLVLGLWLKIGARAAVVLFLMFILVVGQALIRHLPLGECGCFGEKLSLPLPAMLIVDSCLLIFSGLLAKYQNRASALSLDAYFEKTENH